MISIYIYGILFCKFLSSEMLCMFHQISFLSILTDKKNDMWKTSNNKQTNVSHKI